MHPLALLAYSPGGAASLRTAIDARPSSRLGAEATLDVTPTEDCAGTGTKAAYGIGGALLGLFAGWMLNDEMKGKIKSRAKSGAATAAERAAARLRR